MQHIGRERKPAAAKAKKAKFIRKHGHRFCERCHTDTVELFGSKHGEACMEVHHAAVEVQRTTRPGWRTCNASAPTAIALCIVCCASVCLYRGSKHKRGP